MMAAHLAPKHRNARSVRDLPTLARWSLLDVGQWNALRAFSAAAVSRSTPNMLGLPSRHRLGGVLVDPEGLDGTICFDDVGDNWCREEGFYDR